MEKHKCQEKVFDNYHIHDCFNNAKVERNGVWYCGIHDPVKVAEKKAVRDEKWRKENILIEAKYERRALEHKILQNKSLEELKIMADEIK